MAEQILIDADEAKKRLRAVRDWFCGYPGTEQDKLARSVAKLCIKELEKVKPADAVEVVHGLWKEWWPGISLIMTGEEMLYRCSACDAKYPDVEGYRYCPNCGAKMDGERRTDNA